MDETVLRRHVLVLVRVEFYPRQRDGAWLALSEPAGRENGKRVRPEAAINNIRRNTQATAFTRCPPQDCGGAEGSLGQVQAQHKKKAA